MIRKIRTRFAPSPTGEPHIGNAHSALFAWLFARHNNGSFILRIEDTDVGRKVEGSVEKIMDGLRWLGIDWDEGPEVRGDYGPYFQSQRLQLYQDAAKRLVESGHAYYCYCSEEELEKMRADQIARKQAPGYNRRCRDLSPADYEARQCASITPVVRFKTPLTGQTKYHDVIWGNVTYENHTIDDLVLLKSDGYPTYHLANVVDDHFMQITHVLRAEEWISSTPRHLMLYRALGWEPPEFAHLPMLLGPDRSKLSKRHGSTSVLEFKEQGYLPEAMVNFMSLLGWSLDDKTELITRDELVNNFTLERVSKVAGIFNHEKLKWMNGVYMRALQPDEFVKQCLPFLEKGLPSEVKRPLSLEYVKKVLPLVHERVKLLGEVTALTHYFFRETLEYDTASLIGKDMTAESTIKALAASREKLVSLVCFDAPTMEPALRQLAVDLSLKAGQLFGALRTAVSGETATPPLFQMMEVLGRDRSFNRIDAAIKKLGTN